MRSNGYGKPVAAIDIDGTIADYHSWFLRFAEYYAGRPMPDSSMINPGLPIHKFMRVSKAFYREIKLAYRQGGMKRSMPCLDGAALTIGALRRLGAEVWICTTRPFLRLDNIDPDTREWLRRNRIPYDALLFDPTGGDWKYRELKRQAGNRVAFVAEDLPLQAERAFKLGLGPVFLRNRPYNQPIDNVNTIPPILSGIVQRWDTSKELLDLGARAIRDWKMRRILDV